MKNKMQMATVLSLIALFFSLISLISNFTSELTVFIPDSEVITNLIPSILGATVIYIGVNSIVNFYNKRKDAKKKENKSESK